MNRLGCSTFSLKKAACQLWFIKESCAACEPGKSSRAYIRANGACTFMECLLPEVCLEGFDMNTMTFVGSRCFQLNLLLPVFDASEGYQLGRKTKSFCVWQPAIS